MKYIILIFALLIGSLGNSQTIANLDTIVIPSLTLKSRDWSYFVGSSQMSNRDSAYYSQFRKLREQMLAANPQGWNVDVTITNLAGSWVVRMYEQMRAIAAAEMEQLHPSALTNIKAITILKPWYDQVDAAYPQDYIYKRNQGKYIILDQ